MRFPSVVSLLLFWSRDASIIGPRVAHGFVGCPIRLGAFQNKGSHSSRSTPLLKVATTSLEENSSASSSSAAASATTSSASVTTVEKERARQKQILLGILSPKPAVDPVLADPTTKASLIITPKMSPYFGSFSSSSSSPFRNNNGSARKTFYEMKGSSNSETSDDDSYYYEGSSDTYFNLLVPVQRKEQQERESSSSNNNNNNNNESGRGDVAARLFRSLTPLIPPPLRSALATAGVAVTEDYLPMRDLFTSPAVSYAYERGWRQNFRAAGFPGEDEEARMAMDYFEPSIMSSKSGGAAAATTVVVDMSCATGLFTRRFAKSGKYNRVLGCDYSDSMLDEARRRIQADPELRSLKPTTTKLDLVRLDVGNIPMQTNSVDALHAGAAMHCWPDLDAAVSEIYRVLKPGGRYFATTFLSSYFGVLQKAEGGATGPSRQAFQYFKSTDQLRQLLESSGGFEPHKIHIEILQPSCVVIRCEK